MLNYTKIGFNELDVDIPLQFFYAYNLSSAELDTFLAYYVDEEDLSESDEVRNIELCLTVFSKRDYKLEAVLTLESNEQKWIELLPQLTDTQNEILNVMKVRQAEIQATLVNNLFTNEEEKNHLCTEEKSLEEAVSIMESSELATSLINFIHAQNEQNGNTNVSIRNIRFIINDNLTNVFVDVSFTWYLNGWEKPTTLTDVLFLRRDEKWITSTIF